MGSFSSFAGSFDDIAHFSQALLDNVLIPIALHKLIINLWSRADMPFYLSALYQQLAKNPDKRDALSVVLYNLAVTQDLGEGALYLKNIPDLPWDKATLAKTMRLSRYHFTAHSRLPIYLEHSVGQSLASVIYSYIHWIRRFYIDYKAHDLNQQLYQLLLKPSQFISAPQTHDGTPTIPFLINAAVAEEFIFRLFFQGFLLHRILNSVLSILPLTAEQRYCLVVFIALMSQAIVFSAHHMRGQFGDLNHFVSGIVYGLLYEITGNIVSSAIAHLAWNMEGYYVKSADREEKNAACVLLSPLNPIQLIEANIHYTARWKSALQQLLFFTLMRLLSCAVIDRQDKALSFPILIAASFILLCGIGLLKTENRQSVSLMALIESMTASDKKSKSRSALFNQAENDRGLTG